MHEANVERPTYRRRRAACVVWICAGQDKLLNPDRKTLFFGFLAVCSVESVLILRNVFCEVMNFNL